MISATYTDPSNFFSTATAQLTQTVTQSSSSITVTPSPPPRRSTEVHSLTATVAPATATGSVQFLVDGALQSTATLASAMAAYSTAGLPPGTHQIRANYLGDDDGTGSSSPPVMVSVSQDSRPLSLCPRPPIQCRPALPSHSRRACILPQLPVASPSWTERPRLPRMCNSAAGSATATVTLATGVRSLTAMYGGDVLDMPGAGSLTETVYNTPAGSNVMVSPAVGNTSLSPLSANSGSAVSRRPPSPTQLPRPAAAKLPSCTRSQLLQHCHDRYDYRLHKRVPWLRGSQLRAAVYPNAAVLQRYSDAPCLGGRNRPSQYPEHHYHLRERLSPRKFHHRSKYNSDHDVDVQRQPVRCRAERITFTATVTPSTATGSVELYQPGRHFLAGEWSSRSNYLLIDIRERCYYRDLYRSIQLFLERHSAVHTDGDASYQHHHVDVLGQ